MTKLKLSILPKEKKKKLEISKLIIITYQVQRKDVFTKKAPAYLVFTQPISADIFCALSGTSLDSKLHKMELLPYGINNVFFFFFFLIYLFLLKIQVP